MIHFLAVIGGGLLWILAFDYEPAFALLAGLAVGFVHVFGDAWVVAGLQTQPIEESAELARNAEEATPHIAATSSPDTLGA